MHVHLLIKDQAFNSPMQATLTMFSISEMTTKVCFATMIVVSSSPNCVPYLCASHLILQKRRRVLLSNILKILNYCRI